jgi:catechol-2,3-dioxygenase
MNLNLSQPVHLFYPAYLAPEVSEFYQRLCANTMNATEDHQLLRFGKAHLHLRVLTQPTQPPQADIELNSRLPSQILLDELQRRQLPVCSGPVERAVRRGPALGIRESIYLHGPMGELIEIYRWKYGPGAVLGWYPSIHHVLAQRRAEDHCNL